jgi:hypothetical protein
MVLSTELYEDQERIKKKLTLSKRNKGSFSSHHLGLESKNSFMILTITCLAATELIMEFIWNSMVFHLMPNLNTYSVPCHFCGFVKMK